MEGQSTWNDVVELRQRLKDTNMEYFLNENLFTLAWWILLLTQIGLIFTWLFILDKKRSIEIITYGLMVTLTAIVLDIIGVSIMLWGYPNMLIPLIPPIFEIHIGHLPIIYMMVYQYFSSWKLFLIAMTIMAFVFAFILEPLTMWLNIYDPHKWRFYYSFPIYILIGVVFKWVMIKLKQVDHHY